ncbi:MAG: hypothetical protein WAT39_23165, partial [Planctomycetota bacterium]
ATASFKFAHTLLFEATRNAKDHPASTRDRSAARCEGREKVASGRGLGKERRGILWRFFNTVPTNDLCR